MKEVDEIVKIRKEITEKVGYNDATETGLLVLAVVLKRKGF